MGRFDMSATFLRTVLLAVAWGLTLMATLSISRLPGNWGHSVCGPWGCGPPTQALVACHLSWLVAMAPLATFALVWMPARQLRAGGLIATATGLLLLTAIFVLQTGQWIAATHPWQRSYFWQRVGFSIVTKVELPALQLMLVGLLLLAGAQWLLRRERRQRLPTAPSETRVAHVDPRVTAIKALSDAQDCRQ